MYKKFNGVFLTKKKKFYSVFFIILRFATNSVDVFLNMKQYLKKIH